MYTSVSSREKSPFELRPCFSAAVSVCRTTPVLNPATTSRSMCTCSRATGTDAPYMFLSTYATMPSTLLATSASAAKNLYL